MSDFDYDKPINYDAPHLEKENGYIMGTFPAITFQSFENSAAQTIYNIIVGLSITETPLSLNDIQNAKILPQEQLEELKETYDKYYSETPEAKKPSFVFQYDIDGNIKLIPVGAKNKQREELTTDVKVSQIPSIPFSKVIAKNTYEHRRNATYPPDDLSYQSFKDITAYLSETSALCLKQWYGVSDKFYSTEFSSFFEPNLPENQYKYNLFEALANSQKSFTFQAFESPILSPVSTTVDIKLYLETIPSVNIETLPLTFTIDESNAIHLVSPQNNEVDIIFTENMQKDCGIHFLEKFTETIAGTPALISAMSDPQTLLVFYTPPEHISNPQELLSEIEKRDKKHEMRTEFDVDEIIGEFDEKED